MTIQFCWYQQKLRVQRKCIVVLSFDYICVTYNRWASNVVLRTINLVFKKGIFFFFFTFIKLNIFPHAKKGIFCFILCYQQYLLTDILPSRLVDWCNGLLSIKFPSSNEKAFWINIRWAIELVSPGKGQQFIIL